MSRFCSVALLSRAIFKLHMDKQAKSSGLNTLVVEGGAIRSIFSAGLLDGFLQNKFNPFDCFIGVSAGASNLSFFLAGLEGRAYQAFLNAVQHPQFINLPRFLVGGHLLDMDWLFNSQICTELEDVITQFSDINFHVAMTRVDNGESVFHRGMNLDLLSALKASMCLPLLYRGFPEYGGVRMTDGGIANGIPIDEAIRQGATKIMVIRSRHKDYVKSDTLFHRFLRFKLRHYSQLHRLMQQRVSLYDKARALIAAPPDTVQVIDVCPPEQFRLSRFSKNRKQIEAGYRMGLENAERAIQQWQDTDSVC